MLHVVMFVVYVVFVVIPLLYVFLDVLLVQETIKAFEFEFEFVSELFTTRSSGRPIRFLR